MREKNQEAPLLLAQNGPLRGTHWLVDRQLTIGRDEACDIVIRDRQVSRFHAEVRKDDAGHFLLADLESKNGTVVNGEPLCGELRLKDGDEFKIALVQEFLFASSDATLPLGQASQRGGSSAKKLFIESQARRVWLGEKEIAPPLSVSQFKLISLLSRNENKVVTREEIVRSVWGEEESIGVSEQAIDALVRRLRARLAKMDDAHEYIQTMRGVGFIFKNQDY